ncbi:MAG: hypothetical protein LLG97_16685, partial [Deltaproteobacteria bacterium]|nr:hypothetical protein [Deltaproteobacteria bacterium]
MKIRNIRNILMITLAYLLLGAIPGFGADPSICADGSTIILYESGKLKSCDLRNNYVVCGITCQSDYEIVFYETGELLSCVLYAEATIGKIVCKQEGLISFYQDGSL